MAKYKDYGIGSVSNRNKNYFEWILSDFSSLYPMKKSMESLCCYFDNTAFRLNLGLKSTEQKEVSKTEYWIELRFSWNAKDPLVYYQVRMGLLGKNDEEREIITGKTDDMKSFWYYNKMDTSDFKKVIDDNKGHLRIFCAILHEDEDINATKFTSLGFKTGIERLLEDFKLLLDSGDESDVTLKLKGRDFKAHKNILMSRSPVFYAMFKQDSTEKSKEVVIDDCDPETFQDFLSYLYTGRISNLSSDKIASLAHTAEKFGQKELKEECTELFQNHMKERNAPKVKQNTKST